MPGRNPYRHNMVPVGEANYGLWRRLEGETGASYELVPGFSLSPSQELSAMVTGGVGTRVGDLVSQPLGMFSEG